MFSTRLAFAVLGIAASLVHQDRVEQQPTLPRAVELLDHLPAHQLREKTKQLILRVRANEQVLRRQEARAKDIAEVVGLARPSSAAMAFRLNSTWHDFFTALFVDYKTIREEGGVASIPMMQLLLLSDLRCVEPGAPVLRVVSREECGRLADALLLAAETEEETLMAHLYKLHEGSPAERIREATLLAQIEDRAAAIAPHLIEELGARDSRIVQEAITALGMIGPAAKDAIPALEKLSEHENPQFAERAKAALRQIRGKSSV